MGEGFVIMQIGNADLDAVYREVICPAIAAAGLDPRRVDRHNEGDLLKSEIVGFIERADIIVADVTNARPNCYLEVGYAMGLGKKKHLILTVREDHHHSSPNYVKGGPRVHFDLEGYDLLFWDPNNLDKFRTDLERRIKRRLAIARPGASSAATTGPLKPTFDSEWLAAGREASSAGLALVGLAGFWEAAAAIQPTGDWPQTELRRAVEDSTIDTFGWPIGVSFDRDGQRARPTAGGVVAEVAIPADHPVGPTYDYWSIRRTGEFYFFRSYFEDQRGDAETLYFNTRIIQITELLLFLARLYDRLGVTGTTALRVQVTHGGLQGRRLGSIGRRTLRSRPESGESTATSEVLATVADLETRLVGLVKELVGPLFVLFDFTVIGDGVLADIVDRFVAGQIS